MVCIRCKMVVKAALEELNIAYTHIELGKALLSRDVSETQRTKLNDILLKSGLEIMDEQKAILVEKIKLVIIEMVHYADELTNVKHSVYLAEKLNYSYNHLANLFSQVTGTTIEQFIISHKIERAKELLLYDELSITQIALKLNYSSSAHLCNQFKKVTGLSPTYFKKLKGEKRIPLNDL